MDPITPDRVKELDDQLSADLQREGRLGLIRRYLAGDHDMPYMPKGAKKEYEHLAGRSITNWTPLISDTYVQSLFVDGYRAAKAQDNAKAWTYWQDNGLDSRQTIATRGALEYGAAYVLVLKGETPDKPFIRPLSPLRSAAWYLDEDDEYPEVALRRKGTSISGSSIVEVYDATNVYTFERPKVKAGEEAPAWKLLATEAHGMGVCPFVRFRERLDGESVGVIRPLLTIQNRINEIMFSTLIALQYAAFRQRWATGLAIPEDEDGNPIEPFQSAVDRLWVSEDAEAKFGDFAQTDTTGHGSLYTAAVRDLAGIARVSPNILTGDLVNLSADALAQMESSTQRRISGYETIFGEAWEQVFRLAALAAGNATDAEDTSAQVRWRDTEARSLATTVDALGKIAQMLSVPAEALWEQIPGVTDQDVIYWKSLRAADPLAALVAETTRQASDAPASAAPAPPTVPDPTPDA
jgi:hypothetical protein